MKRYLGVIIILFLLVALIYAPIDVPFTLESVAKVLPARQWVLAHASDGSLSATLYDHRTGMVSKQEGYQFDRGDLVQLRFKDGWKNGANIRAGETVAIVASNRLGEQLEQLKNQLAIEQATLDVVATGQKPQIIAQLEEEIALAKSDVEMRQKSLTRTKQLQAEGLIAATALEQAENAFHDAQARVRLAEKSLQVALSGEKKESVSLASSKIAALQKEIAFLENKRAKYTIAAPFDGQIRLETMPEGDRLLIEDLSSVMLQIPLRLRDSRYVQPGQKVELLFTDEQAAHQATILEIGNRVEVMNWEQVVIIKASAPRGATLLSSGLAVRCRLVCGKTRVADLLKRSLRWE